MRLSRDWKVWASAVVFVAAEIVAAPLSVSGLRCGFNWMWSMVMRGRNEVAPLSASGLRCGDKAAQKARDLAKASPRSP